METIKVKPWSDEQGEYVLINAEDFNAEIHEEYDAEPKKPRRRRNVETDEE